MERSVIQIDLGVKNRGSMVVLPQFLVFRVLVVNLLLNDSVSQFQILIGVVLLESRFES